MTRYSEKFRSQKVTCGHCRAVNLAVAVRFPENDPGRISRKLLLANELRLKHNNKVMCAPTSAGAHKTLMVLLPSTVQPESESQSRQWLVLRLFVCCAAGTPFAAADEVSFNRDVRPIFSDKCFFCHGPDRNTQEADLRLDSRAGAAEVIRSGELLNRILNKDPDVRMPPRDSKLSLSARDKAVLRNWVKQGAPYQKHWAFEPLPKSVAVPQSDNTDLPKQNLDQFVLVEIEKAGLKPSPESTPLRWLRRVSLDLTGLPPNAEQIAQFQRRLAFGSREAVYRTTVDDLLKSPAFGEHMAVVWLDAARYADSYGYQSDKLNTQWPYRDWVVDAFNQNLAYDKFLTWQLAGDLLENPTRPQLVATAFNRVHRLNNEGGAVFEEWRIENVADRVHTFGTAVLGLTMECSRCHDHKYDPILMRDYYSLSAFFKSIDESGVYDRSQKVPCPSLLLPTAKQSAELVSAKRKLLKAKSAWENEREAAKQRFDEWQTQQTVGGDVPDLRLALGFDRVYQNALKQIYLPSQSDRRWAPMVEFVEVVDSPIARLRPAHAADQSNKQDGADVSRLAGQCDWRADHGTDPLGSMTTSLGDVRRFIALRRAEAVPQRQGTQDHSLAGSPKAVEYSVRI